jgi:hypothetical protein
VDAKIIVILDVAWLISLIQLIYIIPVGGIVAYLIKESYEFIIGLAVYLLELYEFHLKISEYPSAEKIRTVIMASEKSSLMCIHDRGKLVQVSYEYHLYASERLILVSSIQPQEPVGTIHEISPHHGNLIYDYRVNLLVYVRFIIILFCLANCFISNVRLESEK